MGVSINTKAQLKATTLLDVDNLSVASGTVYYTGLTKAVLSQYTFVQIECTSSAIPDYFCPYLAKIDNSKLFQCSIILTTPQWVSNKLYSRHFAVDDYGGELKINYVTSNYGGEILTGVRVTGFK